MLNRLAHRYRLVVFILFALTCCSREYSYAQISGYTVQNIGSHQGLPSSEVFEIFQDSKGFIWIGTNAGFSRYDGYSFENFQYLDQQRIGQIYSIRETADHSLWFCSETGLFVLRNSILQKINWSNNDMYVPFTDIAEASDGELLIGSSRGLIRIPATRREKLLTATTNAITQYLDSNWINATRNNITAIRKLAINKKSELLIATIGTVYYYYQGTIKHLWSRTEPSDVVNSIVIDSLGHGTWGTSLIGLKTWDKKKIDSFDETTTAEMYGAYGLNLTPDKISFFSATYLFEYKPSLNKFNAIASIDPLNIKWPTSMMVDREGNYWVGSHEGIFYLKKNRFNIYADKNFKNLEEIYSVFQTKQGKILAGSNRGFVYEVKSDTTLPFLNNKAVVSRAEVFGIYEDDREWLWFASGYQGISVARGNTIENFQVDKGIADNTVYSFFTDKKKQLWCIGDNGITKINIDPLTSNISFSKYDYSTPSNQDFHLYNAIEGPDGKLWIAGSGLFSFDGKELKPYMLNNFSASELLLRQVIKDEKGNVWIASHDYGIFQCYFDSNNQLQVKRVFSTKDGLFTNTFLSITLDNDGNLWAGTYRGVSCIQLQSDTEFRIRNFDSRDGFISKNLYGLSTFKDQYGKIWTCGTMGVTSFDPSELLSLKRNIGVYITRIELLNDSSKISLYSSTETNIPDLSLSAANNSLTIHFTALHYSNPGALRYYYRFNATDSNWTEIEGRAISFRQLAPGKYHLQLRASVSGNDFSPITNYTFHIAPPFWQRWWFMLLTFLVLALLLLLLLRLREKNIKEREAQKTELQKLKTISYQYQLEIEQVVNYFATSMSEQKTPDDLLWDVTKNCISKLGFEDCVIYMRDEQRNVLVQKAAWGPKTNNENRIVNPIEIQPGHGIVGAVAVTGKSEIISDTSLDNRYIVDDLQRSSEIAVPILDNGKVTGVIDSEHSQKNFYTDRHLQILTTISSLITDKIDKQKAEHEVRKREIQLITLNRDLATSQLTALRAQMNPHFIFNALNSIQQYILTGDVDQANKYLSKFSRLQREVLNNSDQNLITIEKEIEMLNLYLELEQLRFNENFEYSISLEKEIDPTEVKVPPMILQPFVENAIWHGLMPKKGSKTVTIDFLLLSDSILQCIIRDNGIGREAAARLKENTGNKEHKSKGLNLVYERLQILRAQYQQPFEVQISDLTGTNGEIQGTNVSLMLYIGM